MSRLTRFVCAFFVFGSLANAAAGRDLNGTDFRDFGQAMHGHWLGRITLVADIPGIGKAGDEKVVRWAHTFTAGGQAIVGSGSDGEGSCHSLYYYDVERGQIRGIAVFSGGTTVSSVVVRQGENTWARWNTAVDPDGTKSRTKDTLVTSDQGHTHTWTRGDVSNVWRRARKVLVRDGVELHYVELGEGVPVVFVHSGLADYSQWNAHMEAFARRYRAIAYSRRYNYPNNNVPLTNHSAVVEAEDLAAFIRKLDLGAVHLVGYSYGAYASLLVAVKYPRLVRTLTLAEPPVMCWLNDLPEGKPLLQQAEQQCWTPAREAFERNDATGALRAFIDYLAGQPAYDQLPETVRAGCYRNRQEFHALVMSDNRFPAVPRGSVRKIGVPTLLLYGEQTHRASRLVGAELRKLIARDLQKWVPVPEATHGLWSQRPLLCRDAVLEFLEEREAR